MNYKLTLKDAFLDTCKTNPEKIFLICGEKKYSYEETLLKAGSFYHFLASKNASKQDHVSIHLNNVPECVFSVIGSILSGLRFSIIDINIKTEKLKFILRNSDTKFLVTDSKRDNVSQDFLDESRISVIHEIPDRGSSSQTIKFPENIYPCDIASLIYTSGSTGQPKGVIHTNLSMSFASFSIIKYLENKKEDTIISTLPLSFDYGLYQLLMCMCFGGTLVLEKNFVFASKLLEKIEKHKCTGLPIVPSLSASLLKSNARNYDLSSVRYITNTAAHLDREQIQKLKIMFPKAAIFSMYGLTECKRVSYLPPEFIDLKPNSVGIPIPHTDVRLLQDDGNFATHGEGELVVRGPHLMSGYWKNDEETNRKIITNNLTKEKFLRTGDLFKIDKDGFLYFVSRKDEVVKVNSKKVSLFEVEEKTKEAFGLHEVCAISTPDQENDNKIILFFSTEEIKCFTPDMIQRLSELLEPHCMPTKYVGIPIIPKSSNGKNDKINLKKQLTSSLETV